MVLASGQVAEVYSTSDPDLFLALKGGSNNFGIVTRFDLQGLTQGNFWGGAIQYPASSDDAQIDAFAEWMSPKNSDPHSEVEQSYLYEQQNSSFFTTNIMYYTKPVVNASSLSKFTRIEPQLISTMRLSNVTEFAEEIDEFQAVDKQ